MDKLEEIKKLKQLFDDGIINENDFKTKKEQILGISNNTQEEKEMKSKSLEDYEKELIKQSEIVEEEKSETKLKDDYYQKEKIKAKAKLDAEEEMRSKKRARQKSVVDKGVSKTKRILKWVLTIFLFVFGIASVFTATQSGILYIPLGILLILLGCMACPKITDKTQRYKAYTKHKTIIVWIIIIIWIVLCTINGNNVASKINDENLNQITTNSEVK